MSVWSEKEKKNMKKASINKERKNAHSQVHEGLKGG
jgi:hypothetical protein